MSFCTARRVYNRIAVVLFLMLCVPTGIQSWLSQNTQLNSTHPWLVPYPIPNCTGQKKETRFIRLLAKQTIDEAVAGWPRRADGVVEDNNYRQITTLLEKHPKLSSCEAAVEEL